MKYFFIVSFVVMMCLSLVAWVWQPHTSDDRIELVWCTDDNPVRRGQVDLFNKLHPEYRLFVDPQTTGMEKTIVQCLAEVGPDLFDCGNGFELSSYVRSGIAMDCSEEFQKRGIDPDSVWPCVKPTFMHEGKPYGFPGNAGANAVWYNKRLFDEAGVAYPADDWTWDDFIEIGKKLTKRNERGQLERVGFVGYWDDIGLLVRYGANTYCPEKTRSILDAPNAGEAVQFLQDLVYVHGMSLSLDEEKSAASAGGWGTGEIALFGAEKGAMAIGGRWWLCILRDKAYSHLKLGAAPIPKGPTDRYLGGGRSTLVNARGKNLEGALLFMEFLHSREWSELINRQADALGPVRKYCYSKAFEFNPEHPKEDYNIVWRRSVESAVPMEVSPYVNGQAVFRILEKQKDLVKANIRTGAESMATAAKDINQVIIDVLKRDPELKERYYKAVANGAPTAWDDPEDAP